MMKIKNLCLLATLAWTVGACTGNQTKNETTEGQEAAAEHHWVDLFDGQTTDGWHTYMRDTVASGWSVQNGELHFNPDVPQEGRGDIVTDADFENFELELEWQISAGGNSGIFIGVCEDPQYANTYHTGIEMQVLDNIEAADRLIENHLAGSMYDLIGNAEVSQPKAVGEWNQVRIVKQDGQLTFWLNGVQTADVAIGSPEWNELLAASKFKDWEGFAQYPSGKIGLQDHGDKVAYRHIRIKQL